MKKSFLSLFLMSLFAGIILTQMSRVNAQASSNPASVRCGDVLVTEMSPGVPYQDTVLAVQAGTKVNLTITPLGSSFNPFVFLVDSGGGEMLRLNAGAAGEAEELIDLQLSSSNATIRVFGTWHLYTGRLPNYNFTSFMREIEFDIRNNTTNNRLYYLESTGLFFGAYEISVQCVPPPGTTPTAPVATPTLAPPTYGFPGAPPQDFAVGVTLPLQPEIANPGTISAGFPGIFGYTFEAGAGSTVDLSFARQSGNLSLGLAVVGADNTVVFQTSLIGATSLNATFPIPDAQTYTIGVYLINISPPASPQNTGFTIQAVVNQ